VGATQTAKFPSPLVVNPRPDDYSDRCKSLQWRPFNRKMTVALVLDVSLRQTSGATISVKIEAVKGLKCFWKVGETGF
jgi:hypothetical protein